MATTLRSENLSRKVCHRMQQCEDFPCRAVGAGMEKSPAPLKSPHYRFVLQHTPFYHPVWIVLSSHKANSCIAGRQASLNLGYNLRICQKYYWMCQCQHPVRWTCAIPLPGLQPEGLAAPSAQLRPNQAAKPVIRAGQTEGTWPR